MKKIISVALALVMVLGMAVSFSGCGGSDSGSSDIKIGAIMLGDENEGYTYAHIDGIKKAAKACGMSEDQIIW